MDHPFPSPSMKRLVALAIAICLPVVSFAQDQTAGPTLTLPEAIQLALKNNPDYLRSKSQEGRAGAALRSSYGSLLPQLSSSFGTSFRKGGTQLFAGQALGAASDVIGTNYSLGLSAQYSLASFMQPRVAKADLNAAQAAVLSSEQATRYMIVQQYLNVLQAQAQSALQDTLLVNAQAQLDLARAKQQVGAGTTLDVRTAEVRLGQVRVQQLRDRNAVEVAMLTLFQDIGIEMPDGVNLTTTFSVTEPSLQLPDLLDMAKRNNPDLNADREREASANVAVHATQGRSWLPSLSFSTSRSGYTQRNTDIAPSIASAQASAIAGKASCLSQDSIRVGAGLPSISAKCDAITFSPAQESAIRAANEKYPFDFTTQPFGYSIGLSFTIFDGFRREEQLENATLTRNDARYARRATELRVATDVTSKFRTLTADYEAVQLQQQNQQAAREALELAEARYRVGANTFVELTQARSDYENVATQLITAIYDFHKAFADLERSVGRTLR